MSTKDIMNEMLYGNNGPWVSSLTLLVIGLVRDTLYNFVCRLLEV